jgi:hypothetical protein
MSMGIGGNSGKQKQPMAKRSHLWVTRSIIG